MSLKGFDKFREKTPILHGKRILILPVYALILILLNFFILLQFYSFPDTFHSHMFSLTLLSLFPLLGVLIMEFLGFFLFSQIWVWRTKLKQKYGPTSYQHVFFIGFSGITIIIALAFNLYIPFQHYSPVFWQIKGFSNAVSPLETFLGNYLEVFVHWTRIFLAFLFFLLGVLIMATAVTTFGIDYTTVVYLYFPEESTLQNNQIYSVLRHPMYSGVIYFALGGFFFAFNFYSLIFLVIYVIGFYLHIHFIEEPELIMRFDDSYKTYQKKVPAFFINPNKLPILIKFLFKK